MFSLKSVPVQFRILRELELLSFPCRQFCNCGLSVCNKLLHTYLLTESTAEKGCDDAVKHSTSIDSGCHPRL